MINLIKIYTDNPNPKTINLIINCLNKGGVIIYPTDTVYAIGCLSTKENALVRLANIKGAKLEHAPLSFIFEDIGSLSSFVKPMNSKVFKLIKKLLPGPYTFVMDAAQKLPRPFQKRKTIGVRISNHHVLRSLLPLLSAPIVCTSIHDKDKILDYTTDPNELLERWNNEIDLMLSDGYGSNIPSTVIDVTELPFKMIRKGAGEVPF